MSLSLSEAIGYVDRGIEKAIEMDAKVALVVVDEFGQLVQLDRMDGASLMAPDIAEAKAVTAVNFKRPTGALSQMPDVVVRTIDDVVNFKVVALAGGVPIFDGGELKGAIGVSGATAEQDEDVAKHAISP
jgi:glc operon protein GlcG